MKKKSDVRYEANEPKPSTESGGLNRTLSIPTGKEPEPASKQCGSKCNCDDDSRDS